MKYRLLIKKVALKNLEKLPYNAIASINDKIVLLENDPRPPDCKKLKTYDNVYRVKVGNYRVLYTVEDDRLIIEIIRIAHRKDAYTNL